MHPETVSSIKIVDGEARAMVDKPSIGYRVLVTSDVYVYESIDRSSMMATQSPTSPQSFTAVSSVTSIK
jgi:hypothetical protein